MPEELEQELEQEVVPGEEASESSSEPGAEAGQEEYFLKVNDRQVYKTQDDAVKAYNEAGQRIASYSRYGTPEQIEELQRDAQYAREMRKQWGGNGKPDAKKDPFEVIPAEERKQWQNFMSNFEKVAPEFGYVRKEDAERTAREAVQQELRVERVLTDLRSDLPAQLEARGVRITSEGRKALERDVAARIEQPQSELDNELRRLWIAGDGKALRDAALNAFYGEPTKTEGSETAEEKAERERDANGRFKAAQLQDVKERTKALPKQPKKTAAPGSEPEDKSWQADPAKRLERAKQMYAELGESAA